MALKVGELFASFGIDSSGVDKQLNGIQSMMTKGVLGANLLSKAIGAITSTFSEAMDAGKSFESAVSQLAATMGKTVDEITDLEDKALQLGSETAFTATQAAQGLNILAQAGLTAKQQMAGIGDVLNLASAGAMSMDSAATYVVASVKGFSDTMEHAGYYADIMAKGATLANTSVSMFGEALSRAAASTSAYGQTAETTAVSLLRLADQNVTGSEAATALNRAMKSVYNPTDQAAKALKEIGISAYDSSGKARDFTVVLDEFSKATKDMTDEKRAAIMGSIFGTLGSNAVNKMLKSDAKRVEELTKGLESADGSALQQAQTQLDNLAGDITLFKSAVEGLEIAVYKSMNGLFRKTVKGANRVIDALHDAFDEGFSQQSVGRVFDEIFSALGESGAAAGDFAVKIVDGFVSVAPTIADRLSKGIQSSLRSFQTKLPDLIGNLAEAIPSIIGSVTSISASLTETFYTVAGEVVANVIAKLPSLAPALFNGLMNLVGGVLSGLRNALDSLLNALMSGDEIDETLKVLIQPEVDTKEAEEAASEIEIPTEVTDSIRESLNGAYETMTNGVLADDEGAKTAAQEAITAQLESLSQNINDWKQKKIDEINNDETKSEAEKAEALAQVEEQAQSMIDKVTEAQTSSDEWLEQNSGAATKVVKANKEQLDGIVDGIRETETELAGLIEQLKPIEETGGEGEGKKTDITTLLGIGEVTYDGLWENIEQSAEMLKEKVVAVVGKIPGYISEAITSLGYSVADIISTIFGTDEEPDTTSLTGTFASAIADAIAGIAGNLGPIVDALATAADAIVTEIPAALASAFSTLGEAITTVFAGISGGEEGIENSPLADSLKSIGDSLVAIIVEAIKGTAGLAQQIGDALTTLFGKIEWNGIGEDFASMALGIVEALANAFTSGELVKGFEGAQDGVKSAIESLVSGIGQFIAGAFSSENISAFVTNLGDIGAGIIEMIVSGVSAAADTAGNILVELANILGGLDWASVGADFAGLSVGIVEALAEAFKSGELSKGFEEAQESVKTAIMSLVQGVGQFIAGALTGENITKFVTNLGDIGAGIIDLIVSGVSAAADTAGDIIVELATIIGGLDWASVGADLAGLAGKLIEAVAAPFKDGSLLESLTNVEDGIGSAITAIISGLGDMLATALSPDNIASFIGDLTTLGTGLINLIAEGIGHGLSNVGKIVTALGEALSGIFDENTGEALFGDFTSLGSALLNAIVAGIKSIGAGAISLAQAVADVLKNAFSGKDGSLLDGIEFDGLGENLGKLLIEGFKNVGDIAQSLVNVVSGLFNDIKWDKIVVDFTSFVKGIIGEMATYFSTGDFAEVVKQIGAGIGRAVGGLAEAAGSLARGLVEMLADPDIWNVLAELITAIIQGILEGVKEIINGLFPQIQLSDGISENEAIELDPSDYIIVNEDNTLNVPLTVDFLPGIEISGSDKDPTTEFFELLKEKGALPEEFEYTPLVELSSLDIDYSKLDLSDQGQGLFKELVERLLSGTENGEEGATVDGESIGESVAESVADGASKTDMSSSADKILENLHESLIEKAEKDKLEFPVEPSAPTKTQTETTVDVNTTLDTSNVTFDFSSVNAAALSGGQAAGKYLDLGFARGITANKSTVVSAAEKVATAAKEAFERIFKINSPSRVMFEEGRYIDEGLANGILARASGAARAASEMAGMVREAASVKVPSMALFGAYGTSYMRNGGNMDYERLAAALSQVQFNSYINGRRVSEATERDTASVQNARSFDIAYRYGG